MAKKRNIESASVFERSGIRVIRARATEGLLYMERRLNWFRYFLEKNKNKPRYILQNTQNFLDNLKIPVQIKHITQMRRISHLCTHNARISADRQTDTILKHSIIQRIFISGTTFLTIMI